MGYSALRTGVSYLPMAAMILVATAAASQLVNRIGARPLMIAGSVVSAGGMFWLSRVTEHQPLRLRPARADAADRHRPGADLRAGPIILVGHSYGGAVIANAATGNPNVKALVYVDAFTPAPGEFSLAARRCPARVLPRHPGPRLDQSRTGPGRGRHNRGRGRRGPGGPSW